MQATNRIEATRATNRVAVAQYIYTHRKILSSRYPQANCGEGLVRRKILNSRSNSPRNAEEVGVLMMATTSDAKCMAMPTTLPLVLKIGCRVVGLINVA